jgi:hypothetical protein
MKPGKLLEKLKDKDSRLKRVPITRAVMVRRRLHHSVLSLKKIAGTTLLVRIVMNIMDQNSMLRGLTEI